MYPFPLAPPLPPFLLFFSRAIAAAAAFVVVVVGDLLPGPLEFQMREVDPLSSVVIDTAAARLRRILLLFLCEVTASRRGGAQFLTPFPITAGLSTGLHHSYPAASHANVRHYNALPSLVFRVVDLDSVVLLQLADILLRRLDLETIDHHL